MYELCPTSRASSNTCARLLPLISTTSTSARMHAWIARTPSIDVFPSPSLISDAPRPSSVPSRSTYMHRARVATLTNRLPRGDRCRETHQAGRQSKDARSRLPRGSRCCGRPSPLLSQAVALQRTIEPWSALLDEARADGRLVREAREGPGKARLVEAPGEVHPDVVAAPSPPALERPFSPQAA